MDEIVQDNFIQQEHLPIAFFTPQTEPMPLVRFQANVKTRGIGLCVAYSHRALDSTGVLSTGESVEASIRQHIRSLATVEPVPLGWRLFLLSLDADPALDPSQEAVGRRFNLNIRKIALLKQLMGAMLALAKLITASNDVVSALVGVCGNKARHEIIPECGSAPRVIIAANVRRLCQLPLNYIGNVLLTAEAIGPITRDLSDY
ncbi:Acetyl-coenzyme A synthetase [Penicillium diatomitis]|uniref:Acetyl-coenzyme A synthetase n=1 Tax=Penicillium diatomitis TaxID=2819901 RepID=A0A9X0BNT4_9EURO|nr:Acetyl-coenzyme A synthetase [Penicillium diatomitis]KAJ5475723.1 Acetyl-coenzyme A synthetase [Penicillium diatomitis]